jgi:hypothetical protein
MLHTRPNSDASAPKAIFSLPRRALDAVQESWQERIGTVSEHFVPQAVVRFPSAKTMLATNPA